MKQYNYCCALIGIFLIITTGCSNENEMVEQMRYGEFDIDGNTILVQKRFGEADKYEFFKEITDNGTVEKAKEILKHITWENAQVNMAYPPHYKFHFKGSNEQSELVFDLWISPNNDKVELVMDSEGKYVQLSKRTSAKLFEIITGIKLSDIE
ncbi:hypothetical protein VBD025_14920 [Virgibacillus flavescens]|uniref:hypothetical protein n=1 Tax=Virgibacillus flavescens TaxID=1611422 RepID=UPI003D3466C7